ncbi:MAG: hypothetical protein AABM67_20930 [Acidobacteriota bacterium]
MKTCPSCRKRYEDESLVFCLDDGTRLVREGSDPNATLRVPAPGPTVASTRPTPPTAQSTLTSAPEQFQMPRPRGGDEVRGEPRRSGLPWVFAIVLVLGASGILIAWIVTRDRSDGTSGKLPGPTPRPTVAPSPSAEPTIERPREMFTMLNNISMDGTRITYYPRTSFELCQADCAANANCKGLTWIRPGAYNPGDPGMCYLMSAVTNRVPHACCISAVRN